MGGLESWAQKQLLLIMILNNFIIVVASHLLIKMATFSNCGEFFRAFITILQY